MKHLNNSRFQVIANLSLIALICMVSGCYDRDIIQSKDGVSLPTVTNLQYTMTPDHIATVTWEIPAQIPAEIKRPLKVSVQVTRYEQGSYTPQKVSNVSTIFPDETLTFTCKVPQDKYEYHVTVKLIGEVAEPKYGESTLIYSLGQTAILK